MDYFIRKTNETNSKHSFKLKPQHRQTLQNLLSSYTDQLSKKYSVYELNKLSALPKFRTYCKSFTTKLNHGSEGTIYAHRRRLLDTGALIECYTDRAENCQYWSINPFFLLPLETAKKYVDNLVFTLHAIHNGEIEKPPKMAKNEVVSSIFEDIINKNIKRYINTNVENVDNSLNSPKNKGALRGKMKTRTFLNEDTKRKAGSGGDIKLISDYLSPEKIKKIPAAADFPAEPNAQGGNGRAKDPVKPAKPLPPFLKDLLLTFWFYAKSRLYGDRHFSPQKEEQILSVIQNTYFNHEKHDLSQKDWNQRYKNYIKMVDIARRDIEKEGYYAPDPAHYFAPPDYSRETKNHKEFKFWRMHGWYAKQVHQRIELEIKSWQRGKGPYKDKTWDELLKMHITRIVAVGHAGWLDTFTTYTRHKYVRKKV